jgi:signal transduction histidine kinase
MMNIKVRLALLLGVLSIAFLVSLQSLRMMERSRVEQLRTESLEDNKLILLKWIRLTNNPLRRFVQDFAQWDALLDFILKPDKEWADANLRPNLPNYTAHALWVANNAGDIIYFTQQNPGPPLPLPHEMWSWVKQPERKPYDSFFFDSRDGPLEMWCVPVGSSEAVGRAPEGYLIVSKLWDDSHLTRLSRIVEMDLLLAPPGQQFEPLGRLVLADAAGTPVRHLVIRQPKPDFRESVARDAVAAYLFITFGVLTVASLWLAIHRWVLRPLDLIGRSLAEDNPAAIRPLLSDQTELSRIAQLVESSSLQKASLEREIDERRQTEIALRDSEAQVRHSLELRGRLARDLHDGVIQSIYAAGLGLESAMSQLDKDPEGVRPRLQFCRESLNDVIREVRGFINGIEPEDLHRRGFAQELDRLIRTMQALWPVQINARVDGATAHRVSPVQEINALQICRECISNAVRHGGASMIEIILSEENGIGYLKVRDNGHGFDPSAIRGNGSGLGNLQTRATADMGGSLHLDSKPGRGCVVTVTFTLGDPRK